MAIRGILAAMRGCWLMLVLLGWAWSGCAGMLGKGTGTSGSDRAQVAVLDLDGTGPDDPAQRYVESMVSQRFEVVSADTYWTRAKRLGAEKLTKRNVANVSASLGLTAVIHGKVRPKSRKRGSARRVQTIRLVVRDGESGAVLERHKVNLRRGEVTAGSEKRMGKRFLARVKSLPVEPTQPDEPAQDEAVSKSGDDPGKTSAAATDRNQDKGADKRKDKDKAEVAEEPALPAVEYDDRGQAIDDESPL